jgi:hypothetical protein
MIGGLSCHAWQDICLHRTRYAVLAAGSIRHEELAHFLWVKAPLGNRSSLGNCSSRGGTRNC